MPINSRNKGAKFERDIAKILNGFFVDNEIDYETKRNLDQYQQKDLCIPLYAINLDWPHENDKICVMSMDDWLETLKINWKDYEKTYNRE